ncbi:MAG TPA: alpha/beta hydrolase [Chromobacteriaceae bacterium]|nr:alpha/beta hydrolase [Chromobacteriaceae bacterium]
MLDDDDITLITVPGWGSSGPRHWQTIWEHGYPLSARVEQENWLYPERDAWVAAMQKTVEQVPGRVVIAAHSLGCHTAIEWLLTLSLVQQGKVQGMLLVAPPALPISPQQMRASGELPADAALPSFAGFGGAREQRLPVRTILVASQDDPFCPFDEAQRLAAIWGARLVDAGKAGHMGSQGSLGPWRDGQKWIQRLMLG